MRCCKCRFSVGDIEPRRGFTRTEETRNQGSVSVRPRSKNPRHAAFPAPLFRFSNRSSAERRCSPRSHLGEGSCLFTRPGFRRLAVNRFSSPRRGPPSRVSQSESWSLSSPLIFVTGEKQRRRAADPTNFTRQNPHRKNCASGRVAVRVLSITDGSRNVAVHIAAPCEQEGPELALWHLDSPSFHSPGPASAATGERLPSATT